MGVLFGEMRVIDSLEVERVAFVAWEACTGWQQEYFGEGPVCKGDVCAGKL